MARRLATLASTPVTELRGVGAARAASLEAVGVTTVLDLLTYYPRRYLDRTREASVHDLHEGDEAMIVVTVRSVRSVQPRNRRGKRFVIVEVSDGSSSLSLTFFGQQWRERQLRPGMHIVIFGKLEVFRGKHAMTNPVVDLIGDKTGRIIPMYPQSEKHKLQSHEVAALLPEVLARAGEFAEPVPADIRRRHGLVDRTTAFHDIHEPESMAEAHQARTRLVFDELLRVQLELVRRKRELERTTVGIEHDTAGLASTAGEPGQADPGSLVARFLGRLPFSLTPFQAKAITEIATDLAGRHPMHRLLQGDVGSGKTVVAVVALLIAVQGGHQGALMAPTEVLAEQHALGVRELLEGFTVGGTGSEGTLFEAAGMERDLRVELLANRTPAADRRRIQAGLADGTIDIVIGTHALIQEGIGFRSLGVVVIDEQHRFGVEQRAALREKSAGEAVPDVLVMTATPIPRTAAMTVYGDLDVSTIEQLPPGRSPIDTVWARPGQEEAAVWKKVRTEVTDGRQAYVVCPLIEESDKLQVSSAQAVFDRLTAPGGELEGHKVGLLHGRVPAAEKEQTMGLFRSGALDVLVATTVIEVGVDVPNATVMVILDADRFGIAQLHQLRGRVGRGSAESVCFLVSDPSTAEGDERALAVARLEAMVKTTNGFELAEVDLELRGEGTIMGERQKGRNDLKLASLRRDREWVGKARDTAFEIIDRDPDLEQHRLLAEEIALFLEDEDPEFLLKS
ncbi:MAG: ATP-dependent DNA helicase RecG [Actinobacteria bacterium]|nr:ATP-dependent DNA helicase RecG [Actinomycetota bacterium]